MAELENSQNNPTMEEILQTIRGVIAGEVDGTPSADDDDVLELTEIAEEDALAGKDVLANIDDALSSAGEDAGDLTKRLQEALAAKPEEELAPAPVAAPTPPAPEPVVVAPEPEPIAPEPVSPPVIEEVAVAPTIEEVAVAPAPKPEPFPEPVAPALKPESIPEPVAPLHVELKKEPEMPMPDFSSAKNILANDDEGLVSEQSVEASADAIRELMAHIPKQGPSLRSGSTMEDLVIEAMRPYLKDWLDKNLPPLVKRLVEKEIRRLIPSDE
ncbi:MAG: hypothetical protein K0R63_1432 [Rickettsiales bacterium]|jgi:cell pole-organizing protein PopZ|nr:hypothetical protein [Rickettsiales bacterium]